MKKIIVASLTLMFASAAQSAVLLEKVVERSFGGMASGNPTEPERAVKKTCLIQDDKKMVIKYETGGLVSGVTYSLLIDKNLIAKKIAAVDLEVKANGENLSPAMSYISSDDSMGMYGSKSASYIAYNKKTKISLLSVKPIPDSPMPDVYKANSETATNLKNFIDLTCDNLPTITESSGVR